MWRNIIYRQLCLTSLLKCKERGFFKISIRYIFSFWMSQLKLNSLWAFSNGRLWKLNFQGSGKNPSSGGFCFEMDIHKELSEEPQMGNFLRGNSLQVASGQLSLLMHANVVGCYWRHTRFANNDQSIPFRSALAQYYRLTQLERAGQHVGLVLVSWGVTRSKLKQESVITYIYIWYKISSHLRASWLSPETASRTSLVRQTNASSSRLDNKLIWLVRGNCRHPVSCCLRLKQQETSLLLNTITSVLFYFEITDSSEIKRNVERRGENSFQKSFYGKFSYQPTI